MRLRVRTEKKSATASNHDPDVGVKWKVHRGCRSSQAFTVGRLWARRHFEIRAEPLELRRKGHSCRRRLRTVCRWNRPSDIDEETDECLVTMLLHAATDGGAGQRIQRREQRRGAVALVIVLHRAAAPALERQSGRSCQRFRRRSRWEGNGGLVRSSAWIWLFSSMNRTMAWAARRRRDRQCR